MMARFIQVKEGIIEHKRQQRLKVKDNSVKAMRAEEKILWNNIKDYVMSLRDPTVSFNIDNKYVIFMKESVSKSKETTVKFKMSNMQKRLGDYFNGMDHKDGVTEAKNFVNYMKLNENNLERLLSFYFNFKMNIANPEAQAKQCVKKMKKDVKKKTEGGKVTRKVELKIISRTSNEILISIPKGRDQSVGQLDLN